MCVCSSNCMLLQVSKYKKQNNFVNLLYPLQQKASSKKTFFEKMDNSKKTTVKLSIFQLLNVTCIGYKAEQLKGNIAYF